MAINNVKTNLLSLFNTTQKSIQESMKQLNKISNQIEFGQKLDTYRDFSGEIPLESYLGSKNLYETLAEKTNNNSMFMSRMNEKVRQIEDLSKVVEDSLLLIANLRSGAASSIDYIAQSDQLLKRVEKTLNHTFMGERIFGGSMTNVKPVDDLTAVSNIVLFPTANYYNGDFYTFVHNISPDQDVNDSYHAGHPIFQRLIGAINYIKDDNLTAAIDTLSGTTITRGVKTELGDIIIDLGTSIQAIDNQNKNNDRYNQVLGEIISDNENINFVTASQELVRYQTKLMASFKLTSMLSELNLVHYLK